MGRNEYAIKLSDPLPQNLREKKGLRVMEPLDGFVFVSWDSPVLSVGDIGSYSPNS
jgi:hypothetical protein